MSRVIIGPYKQGLHPKNIFDEHKQNGLPSPESQFDWPEASRPWPRGAVIVLATENEMKVVDNFIPLMGYDIRIVPKSLLFGSEDSMEAEENAIEIARGKVRISLEIPWGELTAQEQVEALRAIGVTDLRQVLWMGEDRELKVDPKLRNHEVWSVYKNRPLIMEAFKEGHIYPGKRLNELMNAAGGVISLLDKFRKAHDGLLDQGINIANDHTSYITYYLKPAVPGVFPLPDNGIFMVASEKGREFRPVTEEDRQMEAAGKQFELDHFDVPQEYIGYVDKNNHPVHTVESLRSDPQSRYFKKDFVAARAMRAFAVCAGIPKLTKSRGNGFVDKPDAKIVSNLNVGQWAQQVPEDAKLAGYQRSSYCSPINSHADIEKAFYAGEAAIVEPYPDEPPEHLKPEGMSAARYSTLYKLVRRLECQMFMENRLVLKPLSEPTAYGRPLMIQHDLRRINLPWYFDAAKFRTITSRPEFVFGGYEDEEDLAEKLKLGWEDEKYMPNPEKIPEYNLVTKEQFLSAIGKKTLGFSCASFASASSHIPSGNNDCYVFSSLTSMNGVNMLHGGGGRYIMEKKYAAPIHLWQEGFRSFTNIGVRVPIASRKEGSHASLLDRYGMTLDAGCSLSDRHYTFGKGCFHVFTVDHIGERQHMIIGPAQAGAFFIGGSGTKYEWTPMALHNAYIELRGYGIFPGFDNDMKKRILMINSEVENGLGKRGYFDNWQSMWSEEEKEIMDMHFCDGPKPGFEALMAYKESALWQPKPVASLSKPGIPSPGV